MSRNFDLLAEVERETESAPQVQPASAPGDHSVADPYAVRANLAKAAEPAVEPEILRLVRSVFLVNNGSSPRRVVFFGVEDESGSSAVCANTAHALARNSAKPVCVVDANISSARLSRILGINSVVSFPGKSSSIREQCIQISDNLWFAGVDLMTDDRGGLLPINELKQRLGQLSGAFEFLIIDAPGTEVSGDAEILGHVADAAVLVVEANKTRRAAVGKAKESLESSGVRLLGTVLNNRTFPIPERLNRFL